MQLRLSVREPGRAGTDLLVDADPASSVAALTDRIGAALGRPAKDLFVDGAWLDPDLPLHLSPIRDGAELGLDSAIPDPNAQGICEVRVVGGPGAGALWRLGPGELTVGSAESDWVRLADRSVAAGALKLDVAADGTCAVTPADGASATLETAPISGRTAWPRRHLLAVGASLLEVATPEFPDAALRPSEDGAALDYARPPRLAPAPRVSQFALPSPPKANDRRPMPWLMAILPLVGALVMAKIFGNLAFLAFAILSPVMVVGNHLTERRQGKRTHRMTVAEYLARRARIEADAEDALTAEQAERRDRYPDPAALGLTATGPRHRLWERRRTDPDRLDLRVGTGTLPSEVVLTDPEREEHERRDPLVLHEVPVTVNLPALGVIGLAGRTEQVRALGRWLLAQSTALHSPADLSVCVLTDPAGAREWSWVSWLPHARPGDGQDAVALLGAGVETVGRRIAELQAQLTSRQVALRQAGSGAVLDAPDVLVILDGSRRLRAMPGVAQLLQDGPAVGIRMICLDTEERLLPEECRAVVTLDERGTARVSQTGAATVEGVRPDLVSTLWCERVARALAPLRDVSRDEDGALPEACRLLDVLGHEPPTADRIAAGWLIGGRSTRAVLGLSVDGEFAIDLAKDGPHGLVAGTTGAGKSELLQTLIASLAVANRPDEMTFVLVDYKGGAAFAECAGLPHTVGMVTDLDPHLVTRALASLGAELRRREHVLAAAGAADLDRYLDARRRTPALAPMPRLLIVIDEFASLARELPDFVTGLVNVAQRGRSLGIHLILATQRPSGVVSNEIRANTNLRIALRVTDVAESQDVIDAPDSARISKNTPGRAYVRLGHGSLLPFQAGRIGGRRLEARPETASLPDPYVVPLTLDALGLPAPVRPGSATADVVPVTDLAVLVEAVRGAAEQLNVPAQASPWLPALPDQVLLEDLAPLPARDGLRPAPFALLDVPTEQAQRVEAIDLTEFGHLLVAGAARSGRSQVLRTIAASLAQHNSCADVHLFGLDCGNGALLRLGELPHTGAIVRSSETERAERLLDRLSTELRTRSTLLGESHVADITEQRGSAAPGQRLAHIVLLIDRWEGFLPALGERDGGRLTDQVIQLLREGAGVGIHVVLAGDHTVLGGRIGSLTDHKIALRLADPADFTMIGLNARTIPDSLPDGRAYRSGSGHQLQVALLDADPGGAAQGRAVARIAAVALERDAEVPREQLPFGVDVLPARITFADAWTLQVGEPGPLWGLVGVGGDRLTALGPDLGQGVPAFVIAGPSRSGRSTALCTLAESLLALGTRLFLVAPRPSPLRGYEGRPGVQLTTGDLDPAELATALESSERLVVLLDDAELLRDSAAGAALTAILRRERPESVGIVLAGDADGVCGGFSGWQVEARKARRGLLLSPQNITDADLIGARVPRSLVGRPVEPGRGLLHLGDGQLVAVQVPLP